MDLDYKIQTVSDHVAKFQGDRPRDLEERVAGKIEDLSYYRTGRSNNENKAPRERKPQQGCAKCRSYWQARFLPHNAL